MNAPRSNASAWGEAGRAAGKTYATIANTTRKYSPKAGEMEKLGLKARSSEKVAGIKAETAVRKAKIGADALIEKTQIGVDRDKSIAQSKKGVRKAGMVAAAGQAIGLGLMKDDPAVKPEFGTMREYLEGAQAKDRGKRDTIANAPIPDMSGGSVKPATAESPSTTTGGTLQGNRKIVADAIAGPELGSWGYEAFNQGGAASGTKVLGKSGSHKETYGRSLTDMTLGEIFHKQNTKQRGLSLDEHFKSGGLHAVRRYPLIGSTLQDEAKRMGLSPDTKFTPQVQDDIFFNHVNRIGNISPWVGPSTQWGQGKKDQINSLIPTL